MFRRSAAALIVVFFIAPAALGCFGTRLKVGVEGDNERALAAYTAGYFVEEKTGIEPDFVEAGDLLVQLGAEEVDLIIVTADIAVPEGVLALDAGEVAGYGAARFFTRSEIVEDLRFTTVERALGLLPRFYSSPHYSAALNGGDPKKEARKAVSDGA